MIKSIILYQDFANSISIIQNILLTNVHYFLFDSECIFSINFKRNIKRFDLVLLITVKHFKDLFPKMNVGVFCCTFVVYSTYRKYIVFSNYEKWLWFHNLAIKEPLLGNKTRNFYLPYLYSIISYNYCKVAWGLMIVKCINSSEIFSWLCSRFEKELYLYHDFLCQFDIVKRQIYQRVIYKYDSWMYFSLTFFN